MVCVELCIWKHLGRETLGLNRGSFKSVDFVFGSTTLLLMTVYMNGQVLITLIAPVMHHQMTGIIILLPASQRYCESSNMTLLGTN